MAWKETHVLDERLRFIAAWEECEVSMAELCRWYGVSRKTGYKFIARYRGLGVDGLKDLSRAPHSHPQAIDDAAAAAIVGVRERHPTWGPKKIRAWLQQRQTEPCWPAASSIGELLRRRGLTVRRRPRRHGAAQPAPLTQAAEPNQVWAMDFKGWFRTGDGERCDPFSLSDLASRYVLRLQTVKRADGEHVWPVIDAALREFGLPQVIRSDNGPPFAAAGAGGLSRLAVKLVKAGIRPERIRPGKPQQNGRHERLHRTVKAETANPPAANLRAQQRRFDVFRREFNQERPHEALGQQPPAALYQPSPRPYRGRLREPEYPTDQAVRRVRHNGEIRWHGHFVFVSQALIGEPVGIAECDDGTCELVYGPVFLGRLAPDGTLDRRAQPPIHQQPPPDA